MIFALRWFNPKLVTGLGGCVPSYYYSILSLDSKIALGLDRDHSDFRGVFDQYHCCTRLITTQLDMSTLF
jgi:hypothetical protein